MYTYHITAKFENGEIEKSVTTLTKNCCPLAISKIFVSNRKPKRKIKQIDIVTIPQN